MKIEDFDSGIIVTDGPFTICFGNKNSNIEQLKINFPQISFKRLKQIHSNAVVSTNLASEDFVLEADAHYSSDKNLGLCVITADCLPIFIWDPVLDIISGIHAGWRGVASKIIMHTVEKFLSLGSHPRNIKVLVGPHIQKQSFEVQEDTKNLILASVPVNMANNGTFSNLPSGRFLIDLEMISKMQLNYFGILDSNILNLKIDTVANQLFHSYRREKEKSGRQISFISRI